MSEKENAKLQTLDEWVNVWLEEILPNVVKESTRLMYRDTMKHHILPELGGRRLEELTEEVLEDWLGRLRRTEIPGTQEGTMTEGTLRNTLSVLSGCMRDAQKYGLICHNPCIGPSWRVVHKNIWERQEGIDETEASMLEPWMMQYVDRTGYPAGILYLLMLYAGLSISEAAALRWQDVDLERRVLNIHYFMTEGKDMAGPERETEYHLEPAVGRRRREVPMPEHLVEQLVSMESEHERRPEDFVARTPDGSPARPGTMRKVLKRGAHSIGAGHVTPRMLRDAYAMRAVRAGGTSDTIAELMGFASPQQVVRRYMPRSTGSKYDLVDRMYENATEK